MKPLNKSTRYQNLLSFIDLVFNLCLGFAAMFLLSLQMLSPVLKDNKESLQKDAVYIIRIEWQHDSEQDVDLWVQYDDSEEICSFRNKQTQSMNLERDNLGTDSNRKDPGHITEEITSIREPHAGWYTVNLHYYSIRGQGDNPIVNWSLIRIKPSMQTVATGTTTLDTLGQEITILRFALDDKNNIVDKDITSQVKFIYKVAPNQSGGLVTGPYGR